MLWRRYVSFPFRELYSDPLVAEPIAQSLGQLIYRDLAPPLKFYIKIYIFEGFYSHKSKNKI
jgi:hypothetical protein